MSAKYKYKCFPYLRSGSRRTALPNRLGVCRPPRIPNEQSVTKLSYPNHVWSAMETGPGLPLTHGSSQREVSPLFPGWSPSTLDLGQDCKHAGSQPQNACFRTRGASHGLNLFGNTFRMSAPEFHFLPPIESCSASAGLLVPIGARLLLSLTGLSGGCGRLDWWIMPRRFEDGGTRGEPST